MAFLLDYMGEEHNLPEEIFDDISNIVAAWVEVNTGDETLKIVYNNGERIQFTTYSAYENYFDGEYDIIKNGKWVIDENEWNSRASSDDMLFI